jgi:hypothetical protein
LTGSVALWYYDSRGKLQPEDRSALAKELDKELESNLRADEQPTKEEKQRFIDSCWNGVELTLEESGKDQ